MTKRTTVVVAARRSAVGSFLGSLSSLEAHEISHPILQQLLKETSVNPNEISEVIMGQVLGAGAGQNPARQLALNAGLAQETPAWSINQVCGSGLRTLALAAQSIESGFSKIIIAGGHESMSNSPHVMKLRSGTKMGDAKLRDSMIVDGLTDAFSKQHMGITAENIAKKYSITREEQDEFASLSQNKAESARSEGKFKEEVVPITIKSRKGDTVFEEDEFIKPGVTPDALSKLKPAFEKEGTVTAGNASGINDGAALAILMDEEEAARRGLKPIAKVVSFASCGVDPNIMGIGPVPASKLALKKAGWNISDLDLIEANEAFAAQALAVNHEMGWDKSKVNVNGGAIAIGHPIGASGTRIVVTLLHEMKRRSAKKGLATLCVGGGMGVAMCFELV